MDGRKGMTGARRLKAGNASGASVIAVIFILAVITFFGVVFSSFLSTGVEESVSEAGSERALYIAEAGVETAIGRLKMTPVSTNWLWNDGYLNKAVGMGTVTVEVLQHEDRSGSLVGPRCESFTSSIEAAGAFPARTVYAALTWDPTVNLNNLDMNLYGDGTCAAQITGLSKTIIYDPAGASRRAVFLRYRIPDAAPAVVTYSAKVLNNTAGTAYKLGISHPDDTAFNSSSKRAVISTGHVNDANREVFAAFGRP
ncbi:MAG: hypothetical protein HY894_01370 [Deltaproteobacteria bacterium]|nr:hypothetical protein [Deltaproteobacteria bacterium]